MFVYIYILVKALRSQYAQCTLILYKHTYTSIHASYVAYSFNFPTFFHNLLCESNLSQYPWIKFPQAHFFFFFADE